MVIFAWLWFFIMYYTLTLNATLDYSYYISDCDAFADFTYLVAYLAAIASDDDEPISRFFVETNFTISFISLTFIPASQLFRLEQLFNLPSRKSPFWW